MKIARTMNSQFRIDKRLMQDYDWLSFYVWKYKLTIGRPVVLWLNKLNDWWHSTTFGKALHYYKLLKKQVDNDLFYTLMENHLGYFEEEQSIRQNYALNLEIKDYEKQLPKRLVAYLQEKAQMYYEREMSRI